MLRKVLLACSQSNVNRVERSENPFLDEICSVPQKTHISSISY